MFEVYFARNPTVSVLYLIFAIAVLVLCLGHYYYGLYDIMLTSLTAVPVFGFAAVYLYLNRDETASDYVNLAVMVVLAALLQYQFHFHPELTFHWIFSLPLLSYFVLPLRWAFTVNALTMLATAWQALTFMPSIPAMRLILIYMLLCACSWCYAYLNRQNRIRLMELAVTDYHSGAYNSRHLIHVLEQEMARSKVTKRTLSLIAITIEDYAQIQDIHGSTLTREVLQGFRHELMALIRAGDEIFHNGKGTFYLLLPNCPVDGAVVFKERLQKEMTRIQWENVGDLQLSTGIATLEDGENADSFLKRASHHVHQQQQTALRLMAFAE